MSAKFILFSALLFDILAIGVALLFGFMKGDFGEYFGEHCPITWLSFAKLIIISGLSWSVFKLYNIKFKLRDWKAPHTIWAIIAVAFLFLACDEKFGIHEALDRFIHRSLNITETPLTDRLDSILIAFYGLVGIAALYYYYREELKKYVVIYPFLLAGFILLFASVGLDILTDRHDIIHNIVLHGWLSVAEEAFKVLSGYMFIVGFYCCLQTAKQKKITV